MLAFTFASLIGFILIMYVLLDGFDLGIGILFPLSESEHERDQMMNAIAPVWDGNETWLVFGGAMLYGAFPSVYGTLLPILYMPIMLMLIALIFRGVSFEFRFKAHRSKPLWNWIFSISSVAAAFFQGVILGCYVQGFPHEQGRILSEEILWLTPFSLLTGIALICGYALLGATWMIIKSNKRIQQKMVHAAKGLLVLVSLFLLVISIWMPLHDKLIFERWYSFPNLIFWAPLPILTIIMLIMAWNSLAKGHEWRPFIYSIFVFLCSFAGIAISVYPYLIPYHLTIWEAAAPDKTLSFILVGVIVMLPVLIGYTLYAYYIFRGKSHEGYHE